MRTYLAQSPGKDTLPGLHLESTDWLRIHTALCSLEDEWKEISAKYESDSPEKRMYEEELRGTRKLREHVSEIVDRVEGE